MPSDLPLDTRQQGLPVQVLMRQAACLMSMGLALGMTATAASARDYMHDIHAFIDDFEQAEREGKTRHVIDIDNDSLLLNRNDGFYSSGLHYTRQHEIRVGDKRISYGWQLGQDLYTASDIKLPPDQLASNDHPYAGWLYAGVYKQTVQPDGAALKWGVNLGCLGPCAAGEWTQSTLHRILNQPLPRGWAGQVKNEIGLVVHAEKTFSPWRWAPHISLAPALHGRFGNIFTDIGATLVLRAGQLQPSARSSSLQAFFRLDGRMVGYNATLQGGYFSRNNPHTVDPRRLVGEAEAGVLWQIPPYGIRFSVLRRSNEVQGLTNSQGSQNIGRLQFSYSP